jgi:hypothetical protein
LVETQCRDPKFAFQGVGSRALVAEFNGGTITSDAGALLLRQLETRRGIVSQFAACFRDHRDPARIDHPVEHLLAQRVFGLVLGYEDLNDHDLLRYDPLLAAVVGKDDPTGQDRRRERDRGCALAGKSTLNRLEIRTDDPARDGKYKKISANSGAIDEVFVDLMLQAYPAPPSRIIIDADATDDPLHGEQEGRFFHGYYGHYCYLPLYLFCGRHLLVARLRESNIDASKGIVEELERVVTQIRAQWPEVEIWVRADSGFARDELMTWCETNRVEYVLGLARNSRLEAELVPWLERAKIAHEITGKAARFFHEFTYRTRETWTRARRVVAKAEHLAKGANPRFIVTSLSTYEIDARALYEEVYCERGEMENRIKEQQLDLYADRTSTHELKSNQLRLYFSSMAYVVLSELRRVGLEGTELERAQCGSIREKLLKIGAQVRVSVRRVVVALSSAFVGQQLFATVYRKLDALPMRC